MQLIPPVSGTRLETRTTRMRFPISEIDNGTIPSFNLPLIVIPLHVKNCIHKLHTHILLIQYPLCIIMLIKIFEIPSFSPVLI